MNADTVKTVAISAALLAVGYIVFRVAGVGSSAAKALGDAASAAGGYISGAAGAVGQAINPASSDNLVNRGVTSAGQAVTGDPGWTLGGTVYETINGGPTGSLWGNYKAWVSDFWTGSASAGPTATEPYPQASYDETERLLKRYPAPSDGGASGSW